MNQCHILKLPHHLLQTICQLLISSQSKSSRLLSWKDILALQSTCHYFHSVISELFLSFPLSITTTYKTKWDIESSMCRFLKIFRQNPCWKIDKFAIDFSYYNECKHDMDFLYKFCDKFAGIFQQRLKIVSFVLCKDVFHDFLLLLTFISPIILNDRTIIAIRNVSGNIPIWSMNSIIEPRRIMSLTMTLFAQDYINNIVEKFCNLSMLSLGNYNAEIDMSTLRVLENLSELYMVSLSVRECDVKISNAFGNLKTLSVSRQNQVYLEPLATSFKTNFKNLKYFRILLDMTPIMKTSFSFELPKSCLGLYINDILLPYFKDCQFVKYWNIFRWDQSLVLSNLDNPFIYPIKILNVTGLGYSPLLFEVIDNLLNINPSIEVISLRVLNTHKREHLIRDQAKIWLKKSRALLNEHSIKLIIVGSVVVVAKSTIGPNLMSLIDDFDETNGWQIRSDQSVAKLELKPVEIL